jgi:ketosteroid isomerase-like protein
MGRLKDSFAALQAAVMAQDFEKIREYIAEDFEMVEPSALPYAGKYVGPEGFLDVVRGIREAFDIDVVSSVVTEAGDVLFCELVMGFTSLRTGERVETPVVDIFRFSPEGKLLRGDVYYFDAEKVGAIA